MFETFLLLLWVNVGISADPNFVFVLTDDQDILLRGMEPMKKTIELVANRGKTFENAFVSSPVCCPNRGTILTGKYTHNTGLVNNSLEGNCSSQYWQKTHESFSISALLKESKNYSTFYAGKYLNKYGNKEVGGVEHVPKGYDWWIGLKGNSVYYNYTLSVNGTGVFHENDYLTDVLANYSMKFLNNMPLGTPFFMTIATPAPHAPFTPAKRHENAFPYVTAVRTPSFNYTPIEKHWLVGMPPDYLPSNVTNLDRIQEHRMESLLAVDELVEQIVLKLKALNILDNTYVIFTSDNGFHIGQFTQPWDKRQPYETDVRVPFIISGPNIPEKSVESYPISSVDIAPTILNLAGVDVPKDIDGKSFKERLFSAQSEVFGKYTFVEYHGEGRSGGSDASCPGSKDENMALCTLEQWCKCQDSRNNTYICVLELTNVQNFKFCSFKDRWNFIEAYNLTADPYELNNLYLKLDDKKLWHYFNILDEFEKCSGSDCEIKMRN